jgi:hypothetical protein
MSGGEFRLAQMEAENCQTLRVELSWEGAIVSLLDRLYLVCCRGIHSTYDTNDPQLGPISMLP